MAMRTAPLSGDPAEQLRQRATAMSDTGAALKKLADATEPLYKNLDENQKRRFATLYRLTGPRLDHFRGHAGDGRPDRRWSFRGRIPTNVCRRGRRASSPLLVVSLAPYKASGTMVRRPIHACIRGWVKVERRCGSIFKIGSQLGSAQSTAYCRDRTVTLIACVWPFGGRLSVMRR
jgi:hypothetical protein